MSAWDRAAARLNGSLAVVHEEATTILRPAAGNGRVVASGAAVVLFDRLPAVVGDRRSPMQADGDGPGGSRFELRVEAGEELISYDRTAFGAVANWPLRGDLIRAVDRPDQPTFEIVSRRPDDGGRVNFYCVRKLSEE